MTISSERIQHRSQHAKDDQDKDLHSGSGGGKIQSHADALAPVDCVFRETSILRSK